MRRRRPRSTARRTTSPAGLLEPILKPLWAAYRALTIARDDREPLDLDLPERKILLKADGTVDRVVVPPRLDAHRLIEEMMIQANVAPPRRWRRHRTPLPLPHPRRVEHGEAERAEASS
jgi:ribonuclease R